MKHRSIGAFVLLAAALFAIPEALQDISSLKGAILGRARGEILQAFFSFSTGDDPCAAPRTRQSRPFVATDDAGDATLASAARKRPARETAGAARGAEAREPREEPAALFNENVNGGHLLGAAFADVVVEAANEFREEAYAEVASVSLPRDARALETVLVSAPSLPEWHKLAAAAGGLRKAEETLKFEQLRSADYERLLDVRTRVRHMRVMKPGKTPPAPAPEAPQPLRQVACDDPAASAHEDAAASGEETKW